MNAVGRHLVQGAVPSELETGVSWEDTPKDDEFSFIETLSSLFPSTK